MKGIGRTPFELGANCFGPGESRSAIACCGAGFVVDLRVLNENGTKSKVFEVICICRNSRESCSTFAARKRHYVQFSAPPCEEFTIESTSCVPEFNETCMGLQNPRDERGGVWPLP